MGNAEAECGLQNLGMAEIADCGMRMAELVDWRHSLRITLARNARRISYALTNRLGLCRSISADPSIYVRDLPIPQFLQIPYLRSVTPVITYAISLALAFYYDTPGQIDYLFIPGSAAADVAIQLVPIFRVARSLRTDLSMLVARALKIGKIADGGMPPTDETMHQYSKCLC